MIRLDYFDEAIGVTEGLAIFEDFLKCGKVNFISRLSSVLMHANR